MTWENRLTFEVSSADPDSATPVWVDFTLRVRDVVQVLEWAVGRQNDLDQTEPSQLTLVLENADDALSYGNTSSPYAAWWGPGRKCRLRETIGTTTIDQMVGYLQFPDELLVTAEVEQRVTVSIVDELARLRTAPMFVSTLSAYIRSNGGSALKAYWPLSDAEGSTTAAENLGLGVAPLLRETLGGGATDDTSLPLWQPGTRQGPPGDDASYLTLNPTTLVGSPVTIPRMANRNLTNISMALPMVAVSLWVYATGNGGQIVVLRDDFIANTLQLGYGVLGWGLTASNAGGSTFVQIPAATKTAGWAFVTAMMDNTTGAVALWVDRLTATGTTGGPSSGSMVSVTVDGRYASVAVGGLQIYNGNLADFDNTAHVNQFLAGFTGLERQTTGERIRTILGYAGITDTTAIDPGQTVMQVASLAGQTPEEAMRDAERTEQGLLYVRAGQIVFKDRRTLYNI